MNSPRYSNWLALALVTGLSSPAFATRGGDDYGLMVVSLLFALGILTGISVAVHFSLRAWTRRTGRKEGHFWLTFLGCVLGGVITWVLVRLAPMDDSDFYKSSIPWTIQIGLPVMGAVVGFFVLRRNRP